MACIFFRSKDEEIDLVDVDAFYQEAPSEISKPVCASKFDQSLTDEYINFGANFFFTFV